MNPHVKLLVPALLLGVALAGCAPREQGESVDTPSLTHDLQAVAAARILLGHQSVGRDLLAGLETLAAEAGVALRIMDIDGVPPDSGPGVFHSEVGENGDPSSKCEVFTHLLTRPERPEYDLAMMKFCYVDLGRETALEVSAMLDRYASMVTSVRSHRPDLRLVHITVPLMSDPPGKKTFLKRLLDMPTHRDADNGLRNAFNDALRERFAGEPLFDLAAVESTLPDGSRSSFDQDGEPVYTLARQYTDDGGHLNERGRRRAAAEFVRVLASALPQGE